jgi:hypothetical protein
MLMNYAVEMGSRAMVYITSFMKIGSSVQNLFGGNTDRKVIS